MAEEKFLINRSIDYKHLLITTRGQDPYVVKVDYEVAERLRVVRQRLHVLDMLTR